MSPIQGHLKALSRIMLLIGVCAFIMGGACSKREQQKSDLETEMISPEFTPVPPAQTDVVPDFEPTSTVDTDTTGTNATTMLNPATAPEEASQTLSSNPNLNKKPPHRKQIYKNALPTSLGEAERTPETNNSLEKVRLSSAISADLGSARPEFPSPTFTHADLTLPKPVLKKQAPKIHEVTPEKTETFIEAMMRIILTHQRATFMLALATAIGLVMLLTRKRSESP